MWCWWLVRVLELQRTLGPVYHIPPQKYSEIRFRFRDRLSAIHHPESIFKHPAFPGLKIEGFLTPRAPTPYIP